MLENGIESWDLSESSAAKESGIRKKKMKSRVRDFHDTAGLVDPNRDPYLDQWSIQY